MFTQVRPLNITASCVYSHVEELVFIYYANVAMLVTVLIATLIAPIGLKQRVKTDAARFLDMCQGDCMLEFAELAVQHKHKLYGTRLDVLNGQVANLINNGRTMPPESSTKNTENGKNSQEQESQKRVKLDVPKESKTTESNDEPLFIDKNTKAENCMAKSWYGCRQRTTTKKLTTKFDGIF